MTDVVAYVDNRGAHQLSTTILGLPMVVPLYPTMPPSTIENLFLFLSRELEAILPSIVGETIEAEDCHDLITRPLTQR